MKQQCNEVRYKEVGALLASDAEASGYFGISAAVDGNRLVVGSYGTDTTTPDAGKVYVYDWNGNAYVEVAQLTAGDATAHACFGVSVAIHGVRLVVGAQFEDTAGVAAGKVYIYDWNGSAYVEVARLIASDAQRYDQFGSAVALSDTRLAVGAYLQDTAELDAGKVYVYDWNSTTSVYEEVFQLTASDAQAHDWFGSSVALSGNRLVVGAYGEDTATLNAGKVYVYNWNSDTSVYDEVTTITAADAKANNWFGNSVAISGGRLVVGAYGVDIAGVSEGKVYVYNWNGTAYVEVAQLTASDSGADDLFGRAVTADGAGLVVGARSLSTASLTHAGKIYIFDQQKA